MDLQVALNVGSEFLNHLAATGTAIANVKWPHFGRTHQGVYSDDCPRTMAASTVIGAICGEAIYSFSMP
jgi:hypothetical protein